MTGSRLAAVLTATLAFSAGAIAPCAGDETEDGWESLFNGKDLVGWKASEGVEWKVVNGEIITPPQRSHLFTNREFKNFELKVDCMTTPGSNSGLYFHTKYEDSFPKTGFEVQVNQTHGDRVKSGSLYNLIKLLSSPVKDNEWYTYHIIVNEDKVIVRINDATLYEYVEPPALTGPTNKLGRGSFALQAHDPKSVVHYKNIRVKPLWEPLFNGKDLAGWKASEGVVWKVENGEIVTPPQRSHLFTEREFKNFELKVDCMTMPGSNSGLYFHTKYEDSFPKTGFEVQVNQTHGDRVKSGSLYNLIKLLSSPVKDSEWYTYYITVKGREVVVRINDKTLCEYIEPEGVVGPTNKLGKGSFAIQAHDPKSVVRYKNIQVRPLAD